jgi:hypothetical protein
MFIAFRLVSDIANIATVTFHPALHIPGPGQGRYMIFETIFLPVPGHQHFRIETNVGALVANHPSRYRFQFSATGYIFFINNTLWETWSDQKQMWRQTGPHAEPVALHNI